ncbi:MAG: hypothetical protein ABI947_16520 [Chloroflexota bacterium]
MRFPIYLAHGALGIADEATVVVIGAAIVAYMLVIWIGDRHAGKDGDDESSPDDDPPELPPD